MPKSLTPKAKKNSKTNSQSLQEVGTKRKLSGVQSFANLVPEKPSYRFDQMIDQTIYIVKLERKFSDNYGDGFIVTFKDLPNAAELCTAGVFGEFPVQQLNGLHQATNEGSRISLDSPVKTTIRQAGKSYRFE